jgi:hypothetical protein
MALWLHRGHSSLTLDETEEPVMKRYVVSMTCALACAAATLGAQQPAAPTPAPQPGAAPAPTQSVPAAVGERGSTTLVGCLYAENQIPGRKPNVVERAGVLEDYILADVGPAAAGAPGDSAAAPRPTGTSGTTAAMYKVENIPDERLKALVGKRVEVVGKIDAERGPAGQPAAAPTPDRGPGPDAINLPEIEATTIREVAGMCAATPAAR